MLKKWEGTFWCFQCKNSVGHSLGGYKSKQTEKIHTLTSEVFVGVSLGDVCWMDSIRMTVFEL
jgi:hypothetical protein